MRSWNYAITRTALHFEQLEDRCAPAAFGSGNLVVYRVGDGSAALTSRATAVFLDEYTPAGQWVQSIALPTTAHGTHKPFVASGNATTEGMLTLSTNGEYLVLTGYARSLGGSAAVHAFTSADVPRVIARVDAQGQVDTRTTTSSFSEGNIRGVASTDGSDFWVIGSNTGVVYTTFGSSGTGTVISSTATSLRAVGIFDSQLYVATASGNGFRIGAVGSGLPTTTNQSITNLSGLPTSGSVAGFFFADLSPTIPGVDTLYFVDETNSQAGGLFKYTFDGQSWSRNGQIGGTGSVFRGLTGVVNDDQVTLYLISNGTTLVRFTDSSGYNGTPRGNVTELATAASHTAFRGVAFAPQTRTSLTPQVADASTKEDTPTTHGLIISRDPRDTVTTHFKITDITHGTLYLSDGETAVAEGSFITVVQGSAGLRFIPYPDWNDLIAPFGFRVQAAQTASDTGLGGEAVWVAVRVEPVNDAPELALRHSTLEVDQDSGLWEFPQFATFFPGGGADETAQTPTYHLFVAHPELFDVLPEIDSSGRLRFTLAPAVSGSTTVRVVVQDSGGTDRGGQDTSEEVTFTIVVQPLAAPPPAIPGNPTAAPPPTSPPALPPEDPPELPPEPPPAAGPEPPGDDPPSDPGSGIPPPPAMGSHPSPIAGPPSPPLPPEVSTSATGAQVLLLGRGPGMPARVRVLKPSTGEVVREIVPFVNYLGGVSVAVGDVNRDGIDDWVVGTASDAAHVKVFDGRSGAELLSFIAFEGFRGGVSVAVGRVNDDNRPAIVVGTAASAAHVKIFHSEDMSVVASFYAFENFAGGVRVAAGDTNSDGIAELAVIAATGGQGHVKLFDRGQLVFSACTFPGYGGAVNLTLGDVTGHGMAAIIVVAHNPLAGPHVKVFTNSGQSTASFFVPPSGEPSVGSRRMLELSSTIPPAPELAAGDLDGDTIAELLLASPTHRFNSRLLLVDVARNTIGGEFSLGDFLGGSSMDIGM